MIGLVLTPPPNVVPLAATKLALAPSLLLLRRHPLQQVWQRGLETNRHQPSPKGGPLCYKEPASTDAKEQHGDGGDLQSSHAFGLFGTM